MKSNEEKTTVLGTQKEISIENPNTASPREPGNALDSLNESLAQGEKVPPVQSFITQRNPEGCFKWMATASFDESQFISTIEQARKGFPGIAFQSFLIESVPMAKNSFLFYILSY